MEKERYLEYTPPHIPHVEWSDEELFDEVVWLSMNLIEIGAIEGERHEQLKKRMARATLEQMLRYSETHGNE